MSSLWDCEKCGYNHYEKADECFICGTASNLPDMVNEPPHYRDESGIECIEVTKYMGFCGGNCFKYLYRAGKKGSAIEDLKKAAWYAERAHEQKEIVSHEILDDIWLISSHRRRNISLAMDFVAEDMWLDAKKFIEAEIELLESAK